MIYQRNGNAAIKGKKGKINPVCTILIVIGLDV